MDCPHCGGWIGASAPAEPLAHPVFDDQRRRIVVDGVRRHLFPGEWRVLRALRGRFERFVPLDFLARVSARDPLEGGSVPSVRPHIIRIRRQLAGTPFAIATAWGAGYGLFPADQVICEPSLSGQHLYRLAAHCRASTTDGEWADDRGWQPAGLPGGDGGIGSARRSCA